jgi:hypothetical protein
MIHQQTLVIQRQDEVIERLKSQILQIETEREQDQTKTSTSNENHRFHKQENINEQKNQIHRQISKTSTTITDNSKTSTKKVETLLFSFSCLREKKIVSLSTKENKEYPVFRYWALFGDSFERPIFFLQLLLAVALERRPARCRVPPLNHLSSEYTLTNHKGRCISHVISMHHPGVWSETNSL